MQTRKRTSTLIVFTVFWLLAASMVGVAVQATAPSTITVHFFWATGCQYCAQEEIFLAELAQQYALEVMDYEVSQSAQNRALLAELAQQHDIVASNVPVTFINEHVWQGFSPQIGESITDVVAALSTGVSVTVDTQPGTAVELPWGGTLDLAHRSLWLVTLIIGFIDGVNPCSLWVLTLLLGIVLNSGSRRKTLIVGFTFLLTTTFVYGLALVGLVNAFAYLGYVRWIQIGVAAIAIIWGLINIKDFFWYKKGVSLTISDKHKPGIYSSIRQIMSKEKLLPLMGATVFMAGGVSLAELPCTAGFPIIWSNLIASSGVSTPTFVLLLGLYLLVFLLDELAVFLIAVITLKANRLQESQGRQLKLIGGLVMLVLGLMMLIDPDMMTRLGDSVFLFAAAILLAWMISTVHAAWLVHQDTSKQEHTAGANSLASIVTLLAQAGLLGSLYMAWDWAGTQTGACAINVSCVTIATSTYAYLLGIPVVYLSLGLYFFLVVAITVGQKQLTQPGPGGSWLQGLLLVLLLAQMLYTAYLTWVSIAILGAFSSASLLLTILALTLVVSILRLGKVD